MNKPISLIREEVKKELADIINNSNLPPFVIEPILQDFLREVHVAVVRQYENDKVVYERSLNEKTAEEYVCVPADEPDCFALETENV